MINIPGKKFISKKIFKTRKVDCDYEKFYKQYYSKSIYNYLISKLSKWYWKR